MRGSWFHMSENDPKQGDRFSRARSYDVESALEHIQKPAWQGIATPYLMHYDNRVAHMHYIEHSLPVTKFGNLSCSMAAWSIVENRVSRRSAIETSPPCSWGKTRRKEDVRWPCKYFICHESNTLTKTRTDISPGTCFTNPFFQWQMTKIRDKSADNQSEVRISVVTDDKFCETPPGCNPDLVGSVGILMYKRQMWILRSITINIIFKVNWKELWWYLAFSELKVNQVYGKYNIIFIYICIYIYIYIINMIKMNIYFELWAYYV